MNFWEVRNISSSTGELILYGEIRSSKPWWQEGNMITPDDFLNDIAPLRNKSKIVVRLNSRGGDVFAAQAIYTQLKSMSATKEIIIDGIAASAATIIAMAGDVVKIPKGAAFMIHNPSVTVWDSFEARDLEQLKNMLESVKNCIIETYSTKTSLSKQELAQMMDDETWLTGSQAVENGFCDELFDTESPINNIINGRMLMINNVAHDLSCFKNMPTFEPVAVAEPSIIHVEPKKEEVKMDLEQLKASHPDLVESIRNTAYNEGVTAERNRMQEIEAISNSIDKDLVNAAKYTEPVDAKELAFKAVQNASQKGVNFLNDLKDDQEKAGTGKVSASGTDQEDNKEEEVQNLAQAMNSDKRRVQ